MTNRPTNFTKGIDHVFRVVPSSALYRFKEFFSAAETHHSDSSAPDNPEAQPGKLPGNHQRQSRLRERMNAAESGSAFAVLTHGVRFDEEVSSPPEAGQHHPAKFAYRAYKGVPPSGLGDKGLQVNGRRNLGALICQGNALCASHDHSQTISPPANAVC